MTHSFPTRRSSGLAGRRHGELDKTIDPPSVKIFPMILYVAGQGTSSRGGHLPDAVGLVRLKAGSAQLAHQQAAAGQHVIADQLVRKAHDRKSTRLHSSH